MAQCLLAFLVSGLLALDHRHAMALNVVVWAVLSLKQHPPPLCTSLCSFVEYSYNLFWIANIHVGVSAPKGCGPGCRRSNKSMHSATPKYNTHASAAACTHARPG